ncbi:MAG: hypothetical protein ACL7BU_08575 [Candidatus Phlomobacter fragariae]
MLSKDSPVSPSVNPSVSSQPLYQHSSLQNLSVHWRIAGKISQREQTWLVLLGDQGQLRIESLSKFRFSDLRMMGEIEGDVVTTYWEAVK